MVFGKMTNLAVAVAAAVLALGVSSCGDTTSKEIAVGAVAPLTGALASTGRGMRNGFELAVKEINASSPPAGRKIRLLVEDNLGTLDGNRAAYDRLVARGVPAILGPFTSSATDSVVVPLSKREKVVAVGPTSAANGLSAKSDYLFRTTLSVNRLVPEGVRCITGLRRDWEDVAAIVNDADTFSRSSHDEIKAAFAENDDVNLLPEQKFRRTGNEELPDLTAQLRAVRNADALFVSALPPGRIGVMVQARRLGMDIPFVHTLLTIDEAGRANDQLAGSANGAVSFSSWSTGIDTPGNAAFIRSYRSEYGEPPNAFAARSYASVYILARAIADAGGSTDSESIRAALAGIRNLDTVLGVFSFDENGDAVYDPVVEMVSDGAFEVLECPESS